MCRRWRALASCSTPDGGSRSSGTTRATSPSRRGSRSIEDEALLAEVAGLVEWPVVLMGRFDPAFLAIPAEVIRATIRANQKCFVTRRPDGSLAESFILVSNIVAPDGGSAIVAGNERVVRARLSDARFFWDTDRGVKLADRVPKLDTIVFHEKLGTQGERVRRIMALARELAPQVGADPAEAERAALLAKADLVSEMVGEFPELQGLMGRYYAAAQGETTAVAAAIEDHYRPQGTVGSRPDGPGVNRRSAGRQARHADRVLGHRREADWLEGSFRLTARRVGRDPDRSGEWASASAPANGFRACR